MSAPAKSNVVPFVRRPEGAVEEAPRQAGVAPRPAEPRLDDAALLAALRAGDPDAATSLYRRARPTVDRTVARLLGSRDRDLDDLVQCSMIAIVDSIHRFRGESSLDGWFARVAANTVFKAIRRRGSERRALDARRQHAAELAPSCEGAVVARDLTGRIRDILACMDPTRAYTVLLHDVLGHDLREISEITEASVAAAQSRLVRGRAELHERIERDPELAGMLERRGKR